MEAPLDTPTGRTSTLLEPCSHPSGGAGWGGTGAGRGTVWRRAPHCTTGPREQHACAQHPSRLGAADPPCTSPPTAYALPPGTHPHNVDGRVGDGARQQVLQQVTRLDAPKFHVCRQGQGQSRGAGGEGERAQAKRVRWAGRGAPTAGVRSCIHPRQHALLGPPAQQTALQLEHHWTHPTPPTRPPTRVFIVPHQAGAALLHKAAGRALAKVFKHQLHALLPLPAARVHERVPLLEGGGGGGGGRVGGGVPGQAAHTHRQAGRRPGRSPAQHCIQLGRSGPPAHPTPKQPHLGPRRPDDGAVFGGQPDAQLVKHLLQPRLLAAADDLRWQGAGGRGGGGSVSGTSRPCAIPPPAAPVRVRRAASAPAQHGATSKTPASPRHSHAQQGRPAINPTHPTPHWPLTTTSTSGFCASAARQL